MIPKAIYMYFLPLYVSAHFHSADTKRNVGDWIYPECSFAFYVQVVRVLWFIPSVVINSYSTIVLLFSVMQTTRVL